MNVLKTVTLALLCATGTHFCYAQNAPVSIQDSVPVVQPAFLKPELYKPPTSLSVKPFIIPAMLIGYGFTALENDHLKAVNREIKEEVFLENPHNKIKIDNYLQYAPGAAVFGLNALGIKGKHNFRDRSIIYAMSNLMVTGSVYSIKKLTAIKRPDGSASTSFPSGHTAEAFASAEFLYQEYKDVSPWYGIAGYAAAATTGYLRMYNNRHWFNDVAAGAGIGIASTKIAYWLYPKLQHAFFNGKMSNTVILPTYQQGSFGLGLVHRF